MKKVDTDGLQYLHLGAVRPALLPSEPSAIVIQVALQNDGAEPWKQRPSLCVVGGNASENFSASCQKDWEKPCDEVLPGEVVELFIRIPLPTDWNYGLQQSEFSLCNPSKRPFGILMSFLMDSRRRLDEKGASCASCEKKTSHRDMSFTIRKIAQGLFFTCGCFGPKRERAR